MKANDMKILLRKLANHQEEEMKKAQAKAREHGGGQYAFLSGYYEHQLKEIISQLRNITQ